MESIVFTDLFKCIQSAITGNSDRVYVNLVRNHISDFVNAALNSSSFQKHHGVLREIRNAISNLDWSIGKHAHLHMLLRIISTLYRISVFVYTQNEEKIQVIAQPESSQQCREVHIYLFSKQVPVEKKETKRTTRSQAKNKSTAEDDTNQNIREVYTYRWFLPSTSHEYLDVEESRVEMNMRLDREVRNRNPDSTLLDIFLLASGLGDAEKITLRQDMIRLSSAFIRETYQESDAIECKDDVNLHETLRANLFKEDGFPIPVSGQLSILAAHLNVRIFLIDLGMYRALTAEEKKPKRKKLANFRAVRVFSTYVIISIIMIHSHFAGLNMSRLSVLVGMVRK